MSSSTLSLEHTVEDDTQTVVLDIGSADCKVGFSGYEEPYSVFPTVVGSPKFPKLIVGADGKDSLVGNEVIPNKGVLTVSHPVERGIITNWKDMEKIWHYTFYNVMKISPEEYPVLLTVPPLNAKANTERIRQVMFETFFTPAVYISVQPVLALYSTGKATGVVVDSGAGVTHIVSVIEGNLVPHAVQRIDIAGNDVSIFLSQLLKKRGYSVTTVAQLEAIEDIKKNLCYVALNFDKEKEDFETAVEYDFPGENLLTISDERTRCPEIMFQPKLIKSDSIAIHEGLLTAITSCSEQSRATLFNNIFVCGGNSLLSGLCDRLKKELKKKVQDKFSINIRRCANSEHAIWKGGAQLACSTNFEEMWMTKEEYDESETKYPLLERPMI